MTEVSPYLPMIGIYEVLTEKQLHNVLVILCGYFTGVCQYMVHFIATTNGKPLDYNRFRTYFGHYPAGSSVKCVTHFGQMINSKKFQEFDYGS